MITLILILLLAAYVISIAIQRKSGRYIDELDLMLPVIVLVILLITFVALLVNIINGTTIDSKIELHQTQNTEIESKIQATVASYLAHERQTYKDLKPDNAIAVVLAYPELHSNELVKKQIELYEENNKKVMQLKEEKVNQTIYKWWLCFGK